MSWRHFGDYHRLVDVKKIAITIVILFAIFFVFSEPNQAAVMVKDTGELAYDILRSGADSLRQFANTLITS